MPFSYNPLWKILIDKGMTKEQLRVALKLSPSTIAKMGRGERVSLEVIEKICRYFNCQPGDLLEYVPDKAIASVGDVGPQKNLKGQEKHRRIE